MLNTRSTSADVTSIKGLTITIPAFATYRSMDVISSPYFRDGFLRYEFSP